MPFVLAPLAYNYDALEPHFDKATMEIHHSKHHQAYVTNLNNAIANTPHSDKTIEELIANAGAISPAVRNNGGGHWNHTFFWHIINPTNKASQPSPDLLNQINQDFGSLDALKEKFNQAGLTRFGSGWAWLIVQNNKLVVTSTPNQDNPLMDVAEVKGKPIMGIDVWEHAYYLKYQNKRADYINAFWNVVNWNIVEQYWKK